MGSAETGLSSKLFNATVIVTALGYLVDMYDFFIFNVVRSPSLTDLGLAGDAITSAGLFINNMQLTGLLIGSFAWGILGDKYGRKTCLFGSILTYSFATLFCSTVHNIDAYAAGRFLAGLGVAGELGAGLTLISEKLSSERRGYGAAFFIITGFGGVLAAAGTSELVSWRHAYQIGGAAGFALFFARIFVFESGLYNNMRSPKARRGRLRDIFSEPRQLKKYIASIFLIMPTTFIPQIIWTLSPELARAQGVIEPVKASVILALGYSCVMVGDLFACVLSEKLRSRKKSILIFYVIGIVVLMKYIFIPSTSITGFYIINGLIGLSFGIWVVAAAMFGEQVGTNLRATYTTTVPNFARAMVIPMNIFFGYLKPILGTMETVGIIGAAVFLLSLWGWLSIKETYGTNLNFEENE